MQEQGANSWQNLYERLSAYKIYTLIDISKKINSLMELEKLLREIMDSVKTLLHAEGSSLMFLDEEKNVLTFRVVTGENQVEGLKEIEVPLGKGIAGLVAKTGEALIINDAQNDDRVFKQADQKTSMVTRNIICVPMTTGGKIIGVLEAINSRDREAFSNDDLLLLMAFAEQAAISITNRKLYDRVKARVDELTALYEISQLNLGHEAAEDLFKSSVEIVGRVMGCDRVSILLFDKQEDALLVKAAIGIDPTVLPSIKVPLEDQISARVFKEMRFIFSENIDGDPRFGRNKRFRYQSNSFVSVPMQTKEKVIGVLNVTDKNDNRPFNIFDVRLLKTIANQISEVYENLRLYAEEKKKIKIEKELEVTRRLQEAIFPKGFPDIADVSIYGMNLSASEVGGDFYDFFHVPENYNQFAAVIADVSGKSLPAALFMAVCRSIIRAEAMADLSQPPSRILEISNRLILADSESAMFVTAFLITCDMERRVLTYSNAGHNAPILIRERSGKAEYLGTSSKPLGILGNTLYPDQEMPIEAGDLLVMYTDGIIEANNMKKEEFGQARLEEVVLRNRHLQPSSIAQKITDAVTEFAGGAPQFDDMTLFIFRFD